ncbi:hypothetical protein ACH42_13245 [Endozoicomonas sp. (ex Bugula neritina AB1)]|nr:hypothetical protein ACH42_13245 [Endozoicomonas sp. (ex Bugula neritina AB1)]
MLAGALVSLIGSPVFADPTSSETIPPEVASPEDEELLDLSLEELISLEVPDVTSVSRKKQRLMDSAAAIYVITSEDLQRSGVTSIPEALRMVPGMQVARLNGNTWSISTRGFNYIFANKLLVLMDGRTVYSPLFSGVNWDVQDTMLEDIDRIEVIRGPGAALWGANAVNGVINIITKHAADTQGGLLSAGFGSEEKSFAAYRYGGEVTEDAYYRAYYKVFNRDGMKSIDGSDAADDWKISRAGFRTDWKADNGADITVQGDVYTGSTRPSLVVYDFDNRDAGMQTKTNLSRDQKGGHLIGNWKYKYDKDKDISIRSYYDRYENYDYRVTEKRDMLDIELQHHFKPSNKHDVIWGGGFRLTHYNLSDMRHIVLPSDTRTDRLYSAFIQDDITFTPNWNLTLSSRFEHNSFTGYEVQPNARLTWKVAENRTFWASVSKAVKTPSISETAVTSRGITFLPPTLLTGNLALATNSPYLLAISGNDKLESENLTSLELGYREQFNETVRIDITTFYNQYNDLIAYVDSGNCLPDTISNVITLPTNNIELCALTGDLNSGNISPEFSTTLENGLSAKTYGVEFIADWQAEDWWKLQLNYSWFGIDASRNKSDPLGYLSENEQLIENLSATHTANLRSSMNLSNQWYFDFWLRYMDKLPNANIGAYTTADIRIAKKIQDNLEISLVGKNLFDPSRLEFSEVFSGQVATEIERSWYLQLRWQH